MIKLISQSTRTKFGLIESALLKNPNLRVSELCQLAGVSRAGYYAYLKAEQKRQMREAEDYRRFRTILKHYNYRGYRKGARSIYMRIIREGGEVINLKTIRRLMKKYGLVCPIRRSRPYAKMSKATLQSRVAPNYVNRFFELYGPRMVLLTDITYIPIRGRFIYLSVVKDAFTKQVLAYRTSSSLEEQFVLDTMSDLFINHGDELSEKTMVHSDQGSHYIALDYIRRIKEMNLVQSMSRRGNCWDNAPQESFFGHMKDEVDFSRCGCDNDVSEAISDYIDYYNTDRPQWELGMMTPDEYYISIMRGASPPSS